MGVKKNRSSKIEAVLDKNAQKNKNEKGKKKNKVRKWESKKGTQIRSWTRIEVTTSCPKRTIQYPKSLRNYYDPYMSKQAVLKGLESGELIKGTLRICLRNSQEAYLDNSAADGFSDFLVFGIRDRNRALNGDVVVVKPKIHEKWVFRTSAYQHWKREHGAENELSDFDEAKDEDEYDGDGFLLESNGVINDSDIEKKNNGDGEIEEGIDNFEMEHPHSFCFYNESYLERDEMIEFTSKKFAEIKLEDEKYDIAGPNESTNEIHKYDCDKMLCYRRHVSVDQMPNIEDKCSILKPEVLPQKSLRKTRLFDKVGKNLKVPNSLLIRTCEVVYIAEKKRSYVSDSASSGRARAAGRLALMTEAVHRRLFESQLEQRDKKNESIQQANEHLDPELKGKVDSVGEKAKPGAKKKKKSAQWPAIFTPIDLRLPKMLIPRSQLPKDFVTRPQDFRNVIFVAELSDEDWPPNSSLAPGRLLDKIGEFGDFKAEIQSLLLVNNIDTRPFSMNVIRELNHFLFKDEFEKNKSSNNSAKMRKTRSKNGETKMARNEENEAKDCENFKDETGNLINSDEVKDHSYEAKMLARCRLQPFRISQKELKSRRDFRDNIVFTIDPATARDLDDALHVCTSRTFDGVDCWEVGVHIADVSFFVQPGGRVDKWAQHRGTSVYLVDQVIPMLPRVLCEELCSLNPGLNRLTFSVVWKMDDEGRILEYWFGRSVIRSCAKLTYDHAQEFIDDPGKKLTYERMPENVFFANCQRVSSADGQEGLNRLAEIRGCVLALNRLASAIRRRRFANGALRLDAPKLRIEFSDDGHKYPCGVSMDERADANFLVEEFMLLANMAVAKRISSEFPDIALLRRHPPPKPQAFNDAIDRCELLGFSLGTGKTGKKISEALCCYDSKPELKRTVMPILFQYILRSMQWATYFCAGTAKSEDDFKHFALNVDRYTHFTSPIRRYPDLIVHRLLGACLGYNEKPQQTPEQMQSIARHCNSTKAAAKLVSDSSAEIFFNAFIKEVGRLETYGIVTHVGEFYFDVILLEFGLTERVNLKVLKNMKSSSYKPPEKGQKTKSGMLNLSFANHYNAYKESEEPSQMDKVNAENSNICNKDGLQMVEDFNVNEESNNVISNEYAINDEKNEKNDVKVNKQQRKIKTDIKKKLERVKAGHNKKDIDQEHEVEQYIDMTISALSIVKTALLPDKKNPGKHYCVIVVNAETARLNFEDICHGQIQSKQPINSTPVGYTSLEESIADFE